MTPSCLSVNHPLADPWLWNQEYRFINMSLDKESTVVYVGANIWGGDGKQIMDMFNW